ncbi:MAG: hypothetical protein ACXW5H_15565 [Thermoanaerobaculia bacterium]
MLDPHAFLKVERPVAIAADAEHGPFGVGDHDLLSGDFDLRVLPLGRCRNDFLKK